MNDNDAGVALKALPPGFETRNSSRCPCSGSGNGRLAVQHRTDRTNQIWLFNYRFSESMGFRWRHLVDVAAGHRRTHRRRFASSARCRSRRWSCWAFLSAIQKAPFPLGAKGRARSCPVRRCSARGASGKGVFVFSIRKCQGRHKNWRHQRTAAAARFGETFDPLPTVDPTHSRGTNRRTTRKKRLGFLSSSTSFATACWRRVLSTTVVTVGVSNNWK